MLGKMGRFVALALAVLLLGISVQANRRLDALYFGEPPVSYLLPKPELFRYLALGYDKAVSSLLFVHMIGTISWKPEPQSYLNWVSNTAHIINILDPRLYGAYQASAFFLRMQDAYGQDKALEIMKRASTEFDNFEAPLTVAMIYFSDKKDRESAAKWFAIASQRPLAPDYAARIAAGIMNDSDPAAAMELLLGAYCSTPFGFRKANLVREFLAYFERTTLPPEDRAKLINEFIMKIESPSCLESAGDQLAWFTEDLRNEIQKAINR